MQQNQNEAMPSITFYYAPGACSVCPHILLHETSLKFSSIPMRKLTVRTFFPEDFVRINPKMQVPVLTLDNETITEVSAICTVISNLAPDLHLMGKSPLDMARVYEWMSWLSINLHAGGFQHVFRPQRWSDDENAFEGIKGKALERVKDIFRTIEGKLTGAYAVGGALTAVDSYLFCFWRWGVEVGFQMKEDYPNYAKLVDNFVTRKSTKEVIKTEGLEGSW